METRKLLWVLDYNKGGWSNWVFLYAKDEEAAWAEALQWSIRNQTLLHHNARLTCFPKGFRVHMEELPGEIRDG